MNNKTLSILALLPIWSMFILGFIGINMSQEFTVLSGIVMMIFGTWCPIRLYRIKD